MDDPLAGLSLTEDAVERAEHIPEDWVRVRVKAAGLNHHDVWSLRGVGVKEDQLPMTLGCDAAGVTDDGREVIVHAVINQPGWVGDQTLDPKRNLLSEVFPGTLARYVWVPEHNLVPKPSNLTWEQAGCISTAYLTAYRMLFTVGELRPGQTVLIQGSGGGVATAATILAHAAGLTVWVTGREAHRREKARNIGANEVFETGARLPSPVDAVIETVGKATWAHSLRAVKPGGKIIVAGSTSGPDPSAELSRVFFRGVSILGTTMGERTDLEAVASLCAGTQDVKPVIDSTWPAQQAREAFAHLIEGNAFGKVVLTI